MFSHPKILFFVSLLFVAVLNPKFNPYLLFKFLIFYHSSIYITSSFRPHILHALKFGDHTLSKILYPLQENPSKSLPTYRPIKLSPLMYIMILAIFLTSGLKTSSPRFQISNLLILEQLHKTIN